MRDISAQYRQSVLGILWALINPLTTTAIWRFLSTSRLVQVAETGLPYPVFVFTGTLLWSILMDAFNAPLGQVNGNRSLLVLPFVGVHASWGCSMATSAAVSR